MKPDLYCLGQDAPPGFRHHRPTEAELLSGPFAVFVDCLEDAFQLTPLFKQRACGLILSVGSQTFLDRINTRLNHLIVREEMLQDLAALAHGILALQSESKVGIKTGGETVLNSTEQARVGVFRCDLNGRINFANPMLLEILDFKSVDEIHQIGLDTIYKQETSRELLLQKVLQGPVDEIEVELVRGDGRIICALLGIYKVTAKDGRTQLIEGTLLDITEQKKRERERSLHLSFLQAMDQINNAIRQAANAEELTSDVLKVTLELFKSDRAWLLYPCDPSAKTWSVPMEHTRPEYPGALAIGQEFPMLPEMADVINNALNIDDVSIITSHPSQMPREISEKFLTLSQMHFAIHPLSGKPWLFGLHQCSYERVWTTEEQNLFREIGRRLGDGLSTMLAHQKVQNNEAVLREAQRVANIGSWSHDLIRDEYFWSEQMFRLVGVDPIPISLEAILERVHPEDRDLLREALEASSNGLAQNEQQFRITHSSGEIRWIHNRWVSTYDEKGREIKRTGTSQDVTAQKRTEAEKLSLERQVQHAQKLESLGVLAGGIAHDFNNLLMAILGNADLALDEISPMSPARPLIQDIEKASKRAAELAKQMLAYSGKGQFVIEAIDAGELLEEMAHLLEVSISRNVILKFNFAKNLPVLKGDATQIRQVVLNLITNASESISDKSGVIALSTGAMKCDRSYLDATNDVLSASLAKPLPVGVYVYYEVADTGCGMDARTIERVFDPFFTTKFTGRGLGMSAVLGIIRGHGGAIKIYSEVGKGTTFKVLFPAVEENGNLKRILDQQESNVSQWRGSGTVLIVDDEETVIAVGHRMLQRLGFEVYCAANGAEALELFREYHNEIVFVLLDLTMPRMDGEQTFREMRRIKPEVCVVLCSGYNEQDATQRFMGKGLAGFIQKPYTMAQLREGLSSLLD